MAYLACSAGRAVPRERLATLLWGERGHEQARQSLRQELHELKDALGQAGASPLRTDNQSVSLDPNAVWVDAVEAEALVADGSPDALARAADLYKGEFLSDLQIDSAEFEDWVEVARGRFRDLALQALTGLVEHERRSGRIDHAIEAAKRALGIDPCREDLHRQLMRLYLSKGMRSSALAQFLDCRGLLRRELDAPPDEETDRLYRQILESGIEASQPVKPGTESPISGGPPGHAGPTAARWGDIAGGRRAQLDAMLQGFERAQVPEALVLIVGDAGAGKTYFVNALVRGLSARNAAVLQLRARPSDRAARLAPWTELLEHEANYDPAAPAAPVNPGFAELPAVSSWTGGPAERDMVAGCDPSFVSNATLEVIRARGTDGPLLVIFEDLHWADEDSLRVLFHVMHRVRRTATLFVATARSEEVDRPGRLSATLRDLAQEAALRRVELAPLTRGEIDRLIEQAWRRRDRTPLSRRVVNEIRALSDGNPGIALECFWALAERRGSRGPPARILSDRIRRRVADSLSGLSDHARSLASLASMSARRSELVVLRLASGLGEEEAMRAVEELVASGILTVDGEFVEFARSHVRRAVCEDVPGPRHRALHARLARAVAQAHGADLTAHHHVLARHWREAGEPAQALPCERRAGLVDLNRGAWRSAERRLRQALKSARTLADGDMEDPNRVDAWLGLASLAEHRRDLDAALAALVPLERRLGAIAGVRQRAQALHALARICQMRNDQEAALGYARRALRECEGDGAAHLWLPAERLMFRMHVVDRVSGRAAERARRAQERARALRLRRDEATTAGLRAVLHAIEGDTDAALAAADESVRAAERLGDDCLVAGCLQNRGFVRAWHGDADAALSCLERAGALAEGQGDLIRSFAVRGHRGFALSIGGRYDEAVVELHAALDQGDRLGTDVYRPWFLAWLAEAAAAAGDHETARLAAREALSAATRANQPWPHAVALRALARVLAHPGERDSIAAAVAIAQALQRQESLGLKVERARSLSVRAKVAQRTATVPVGSGRRVRGLGSARAEP